MTDKNTLQTLINQFVRGDLRTNALNFFTSLGYASSRMQNKTVTEIFGYRHDEIVDSAFLFQLAADNLDGVQALPEPVDNTIMESYMFVAIELKQPHYSRSDLVKITRELNKSQQPILILFKYGNALTLSVIHRRLNKNDDSRDVLEKVTLIKDIRLENTHRAHLDILADLAFSNLKPKPTNFVELHNAWQGVLNTKTLNKQFYEKLFDWYLFALSEVKFPQIRAEADLVADEQHQSESLIRLLTRLLFVWFMKEKGLIDAKLFDQTELKSTLKNFTGENSDDTIFYKAILQNLFFATLNMPIEQRKVIPPRTNTFPRKEHGDQLLYRYTELFNNSDFEKHFADIPFLNGGLFDCLDRTKPESPVEIRIDGFTTSSKKEKQAVAPDKLFFGEYKNVDLSGAYDNKKKSNVTVYGLIDILQNHKFTVEENTPLEEDIALDPELLGQVFENLLAAYNPETGTTARKQTGSFYTPREIVDYMVDESLIAYFENEMKSKSPLTPLQKGGDSSQNVDFNSGSFEVEHNNSPLFEGGRGGISLRHLLSYNETQNPFDPQQTNALIQAIDNLKILDPACGSGAFPMGILHKLVFVLSKLDPKNEKWRDRQIAKLKDIDDSALREKATQVIHDAFENNELDYGRKLFLIENCIHGVDIQPIATQISKLRFFISLIVDQKSHGDKSNNFGIRPLPNLDFKIIAANTLIAAPQDDFENNALFSNDSFFENFSDLTHDYFKVANPDDKRKLRDKIETLINAKCAEKIKAIESLSHNEAKYKKQIDQLESHKKLWQSYANLFKHEAVSFFEPRYFFPQLSGGFDIVIGNPPYVQVKKGIFSASQFPYSEGKDKGKQNLYKVFTEQSFNLIKNGGVASLIVQSSLMADVSAQYTRELLLTKTKISFFIEFPKKPSNAEGQVFENVLQGTCVYLFKKELPDEKASFKVSIDNDVTTVKKLIFDDLIQSELIKIYPNGFFIPLVKPKEFALTQKVFNQSKPLSEFITGSKKGDLSSDTDKKLFFEKTEGFKLIRGNNVQRYFCKSGFDFVEINDKTELMQQKNNEQSIIAFQNITGTVDLHRIHSCLFEKQDDLIFLDTTIKVYVKENANPKFLLACINSSLMDWYFRKTSTNNHVNGYEIEALPIPKIPADQQQPFITLVDKILADKKAGNDTSTLEREIDGLVYGLYGLSDEEILIVEGGK